MKKFCLSTVLILISFSLTTVLADDRPKRPAPVPQPAPVPERAPVIPIESLSIAGAKLTLGEKQEDVERRLSERYKLIHHKNTILVTKKEKPFGMLGSLEFQDGLLEGISKSWGTFRGQEAVDLFESIFNSLSGGKEAILIGSVSTSIMREPNLSTKTITIDFLDNRSLTITIFEKVRDISQPQISVTESVETVERQMRR